MMVKWVKTMMSNLEYYSLSISLLSLKQSQLLHSSNNKQNLSIIWIRVDHLQGIQLLKLNQRSNQVAIVKRFQRYNHSHRLPFNIQRQWLENHRVRLSLIQETQLLIDHKHQLRNTNSNQQVNRFKQPLHHNLRYFNNNNFNKLQFKLHHLNKHHQLMTLISKKNSKKTPLRSIKLLRYRNY